MRVCVFCVCWDDDEEGEEVKERGKGENVFGQEKCRERRLPEGGREGRGGGGGGEKEGEGEEGGERGGLEPC